MSVIACVFYRYTSKKQMFVVNNCLVDFFSSIISFIFVAKNSNNGCLFQKKGLFGFDSRQN